MSPTVRFKVQPAMALQPEYSPTLTRVVSEQVRLVPLLPPGRRRSRRRGDQEHEEDVEELGYCC